MRSFKTMLAAMLILSMSVGAYAELQSVTTSGSLRIRGNSYNMDGLIPDASWVESRTRLGVQANFTDSVSAVIELDSYDTWGEDFRSLYVTSVDMRAASVDDVEVYQAYIEAQEMWGTPLQLRIGRQEMQFGSEWLIGNNDTAALYRGLSFDGVRATYAVDTFSVDAFWTKLAESGGDFTEDDVDFYGLYFSYLGLEDHVIDAYWLWIRENNSGFGPLPVPGLFGGNGRGAAFAGGPAHAFFGGGINDGTDIHTFGLRGAGTFGAFDYEAEIAYQTGEAEVARGLAARLLGINLDRDYNELALNVEVGYTFDMNYTPRVYLGFAYLGGGDAGDTGGLFRTPGRDQAFNRLFSDWEYSEFLENTDLSNALIYRGGLSVVPTESLELSLIAAYFQADDALEQGIFVSDEDTIGLEVGLYATYTYSDDLAFNAGWAHFFGDDGLGQTGRLFRGARFGNPITLNGTGIFGGPGAAADENDDYDYLFLETEIKF